MPFAFRNWYCTVLSFSMTFLFKATFKSAFSIISSSAATTSSSSSSNNNNNSNSSNINNWKNCQLGFHNRAVGKFS